MTIARTSSKWSQAGAAPVQLVAALAIAATAFAGGWSAQGWRLGQQIEQINRQHLQRDFRALETAHADTIRLQTAKDQAETRAKARAADLARAADAARTERDGLRDELTAQRSRLPDAACPAVREYAAAVGELFGECAAALERLAVQAGGHASDALTLLEAWPALAPKSKAENISDER